VPLKLTLEIVQLVTEKTLKRAQIKPALSQTQKSTHKNLSASLPVLKFSSQFECNIKSIKSAVEGEKVWQQLARDVKSYKSGSCAELERRKKLKFIFVVGNFPSRSLVEDFQLLLLLINYRKAATTW
jgi:hypothetical protein